ncbi:MAG: TAXI family TRAP transporter solute-binding subunit [Methyloligellaceae bacterium]
MIRLKHLVLLAGACALATTANAQERYRFGGGPSGGAWHPAISAGTQILNKELKGKVNFQYSPSAGSVANVRRVGQGEFATSWGHVGQVWQSWNGVGLFEKDGANKDFRIIANVRAQSQIIAVLADSPIKSFADMKGKKVNLLARGTGSHVNCKNIFAALGLIDQIDQRNLGFRASGQALGDRQIDVYCSAGAPFTIPALTQLSISKPVRYISMTEEEQKKVTSAHRFYVPVTIPVQKDVKGMDAPALSIAYDVWWIAHKKMSDDSIYNMLKIIAAPENLKQLTKTARYWRDLSGNFNALKEHKIFVHPAAAKYWKERGVEIPGGVVKGY